jgi:hypothetical protein
MVVAALAAALWWALSRRRRPPLSRPSAFVGPDLGVNNGSSLDQALSLHPAIRSERRIAPNGLVSIAR